MNHFCVNITSTFHTFSNAAYKFAGNGMQKYRFQFSIPFKLYVLFPSFNKFLIHYCNLCHGTHWYVDIQSPPPLPPDTPLHLDL